MTALLMRGTFEHISATTYGGVASRVGKWHFGIINECLALNSRDLYLKCKDIHHLHIPVVK
nr:hypothetical protein Iba_chr08bCG8620 [Ipomoea batatas]GMD27026.1 hypothetical protein Iba_chr08dCG9820 [Ipomoea batatas]